MAKSILEHFEDLPEPRMERTRLHKPEGIAVANPPIQKNRKNQQPFNPSRNVNNNLNKPHLLKYQEKSEILSTKHALN